MSLPLERVLIGKETNVFHPRDGAVRISIVAERNKKNPEVDR